MFVYIYIYICIYACVYIYNTRQLIISVVKRQSIELRAQDVAPNTPPILMSCHGILKATVGKIPVAMPWARGIEPTQNGA